MKRILAKVVFYALAISTLIVIIGDDSFAQKCEVGTCNIKSPKCSSSYEFTIHRLNKLYKDLLNDGKKFLKGISMYNEDDIRELYQYVYFGNTSQANPIKWRVLSTTANDYGNTPALFMVTEQAICLKDMKDMYNINEVLGGKLLGECFTELEQNTILETSNLDDLLEQKLFLLSQKEVTSRQYGFWKDENRNALRTLKMTDEGEQEYNVEWWLRDTKTSGNRKVRSMVGEFGEITQRTYGNGGIRVALNIPFCNIVCTHNAQQVYEKFGTGSKLYKVNSNKGNEFKLTILDVTRSDFKVNQEEVTAGIGEIVELDYMSAISGMDNNREYISAVIKDKKGRQLYYGKLANVDTSGSGRVSIMIPKDIKQGEYMLVIMNEQENGERQTNYAGYDTVKLVIEKRTS